jgi:hypothetical protein
VPKAAKIHARSGHHDPFGFQPLDLFHTGIAAQQNFPALSDDPVPWQRRVKLF